MRWRQYFNKHPPDTRENSSRTQTRRDFLQDCTASTVSLLSITPTNHRAPHRNNQQPDPLTGSSTSISEMRPVQTVWDAGPITDPDTYDRPPEDVVTVVNGKRLAVLSRVNWTDIPDNVTNYTLTLTTQTDRTQIQPLPNQSPQAQISPTEAKHAAHEHETKFHTNNDSTARFTSQVTDITPPTARITTTHSHPSPIVTDELTLTVTGETPRGSVVVAKKTKTLEIVTVPPLQIHVIRQVDNTYGTVTRKSLHNTRDYLHAYLKRILPISNRNLNITAHPDTTFTINTDWNPINTTFSEETTTNNIISDVINTAESHIDKLLLKTYLAMSTLGPVINIHETKFADTGPIPNDRTYTIGLFAKQFRYDHLARTHPEFFAVNGLTRTDRANACVSKEQDFTTIAHELGHQLGLYNTTEEYNFELTETAHKLNGYDVFDHYFPYAETGFTGRTIMGDSRAETTTTNLHSSEPFISKTSSEEFTSDIAWISNTIQTVNDQQDYDRLIQTLRKHS